MRPAWYALPSGGARDYVTLLHVPYTAWHLGYVTIGGCIATTVDWARLGLTLLAFFLALGVAAHALDELTGRPLQTTIPSRALASLAACALAGACAIGIVVAVDYRLWLLAFVAAGGFLVPAYNLELFGARFHSDAWFAFAWGAFPILTGYAAVAGRLDASAMLAAVGAFALSLAQRRLSTAVRELRRSVVAVEGSLELAGGGRRELTRESIAGPPERALQLLSVAVVALAAALAVGRA